MLLPLGREPPRSSRTVRALNRVGLDVDHHRFTGRISLIASTV